MVRVRFRNMVIVWVMVMYSEQKIQNFVIGEMSHEEISHGGNEPCVAEINQGKEPWGKE